MIEQQLAQERTKCCCTSAYRARVSFVRVGLAQVQLSEFFPKWHKGMGLSVGDLGSLY